MDLQSNPVNEILYISFNQDFTCFVCGTENGFRVYNTDPFRLTYRRDFENGSGLGVIAMLFRTNILAFAGGGKSPRFPPYKVVLWDDRKARVIAELSFRSAVKSVRLRRDLVVAVLNNKVYVYGFRSLSLFDSIETTDNPKGLVCLSTEGDRAVLVCPGRQQGRALVIYYPRSFGDMHAPVQRERTNIIAAHESAIAAMSIDSTGTLLATASDKGTILRVYDTASGARLQELRRGADRAEIHSLTFSPNGEWLAVSSDKGTIHIFSTGSTRPATRAAGGSAGSQDAALPTNSKSSLQRLSRVLPAYFSSEWSLAQFRVPDYRCIAAFGSDPNTIVVVCANGSYYKARFDPARGGEMVREEYAQFDDATVESSQSRDAEQLSGATATNTLPEAQQASPPPPPAPAQDTEHVEKQDDVSPAASAGPNQDPAQEAGDLVLTGT
mmetsp:Transcript_112960/g.300076  ORF Transcript_112960/g.300076 Transcript_112960/m.300076 type:complete len:440 (-) Transcript_112960:103-1422(-)